jgi:cytochrome c oxidase subunit 4
MNLQESMPMADTSHAGGHAGPNVGLYLTVGVALSVFTALSFVFNTMARKDMITHDTSFVLILGVAVCKAVLVGMFFMHLKYDWFKLYFLIVPAFILGAMMMFVLLPDIVLAWHKEPQQPPVTAPGGHH